MGGKASSSGGSCYTVGYRYSAGIHQVLCQGPVDAVLALAVGERLAWSGTATGGEVAVNAPSLFGGDDREGGVVGTIDLALGAPAQAPSLYLAEQLGLVSGTAPGSCYLEVAASEETDLGAAVDLDGELEGLAVSESVTLANPGVWVRSAERYDIAETVSVGAVLVGDVAVRRADTEASVGTLPAGDLSADLTLDISADTRVIGALPAWRGVVSAIWQRVQHSANNPYLKPVRWLVRRQTPADGWYPATSAVLDGMNPAHILHELLVSPVWGLGYPSAALDEDSFRAAADTLYSEGLGLSLVWEEGTVEDLAQTVLDHIEGRLYVSPSTGLWVLALLRADYVAGDLPLLDASVIVRVESYERRGWDETANEVVVEYTDTQGLTQRVTAQNLANIAIQGGVVSVSRSYPGARSAALAGRLAQRDLEVLSRPLARWRVRVNRTAWAWGPGEPLRLTWPEYGVADMVCRVAEVDAGSLTEGEMGITLVEDVFGIPSASYLAEQPPQWTDPASEPLPCPHQTAIEAPYWDVARSMSADALAGLIEGYGFLLTCGERPSAIHYDYRIYADSGSGYAAGPAGLFSPTAVLAAGAGPADAVLVLGATVELSLVTVGTWAQIGEGRTAELVAVLAVDLGSGEISVARGVLDTTPVSWAAGARVWFGGSRRGSEGTERVDGETIDLKLVTRTGLGPLALGDAAAMTVELDNRASRPYPPGNVMLNGSAWPASVTGDLTITWAHRDRTQQTAYLVEQDEGDIGPEAGTTYRVRIYDMGSAIPILVRSWTGLTGTSQIYTAAQRTADFARPAPHPMRVLIDAQRGGLDSYQPQRRDPIATA